MIIHAVYLINCASEDKELRDKSLTALTHALHVADKIGADGVVLHAGLGAEGRRRRRRSRARARSSRPRWTTPTSPTCTWRTPRGRAGRSAARSRSWPALLEAAGGGKRLGVCLDSCHLLASGYDVRTADAVSETLAAFDEEVGLDRLQSLHVNDSKMPLGSNRDRHTALGEGEIGAEGCAAFLSRPRLRRPADGLRGAGHQRQERRARGHPAACASCASRASKRAERPSGAAGKGGPAAPPMRVGTNRRAPSPTPAPSAGAASATYRPPYWGVPLSILHALNAVARAFLSRWTESCEGGQTPTGTRVSAPAMRCSNAESSCVERVTVKPGPSRSRRGPVGGRDLEDDLRLPRVLGEQVLEVVDDGRRAGGGRRCGSLSGTATRSACSRGGRLGLLDLALGRVEQRRLGDDHAGLALVLLVDAAADDDDVVLAQRAPRRTRASSRRRTTSTLPSRSSMVANIIVEPERVRIFFAADTMPPIFTHSPSLRPGRSAHEQSTLAAQRLAHRLERVLGDEQPDGLLLQRRAASRRSYSSIGMGGCDGRANAGSPPHGLAEAGEVEDRGLADLRVQLGLLARRPARPPAPRACPCGSRRWSRRRRT